MAPPVTLRRFRDLGEALIAESVLDSAEVECFLIDENIVRLSWPWSNFVGGIKLWVREEDSEAAAGLLDQAILGKFDGQGIGEYEQPICPVCNSLNISHYRFNRRLAFWFLFLFPTGLFFIPRNRLRWSCNSCGHKWKEANEQRT